jgi:hypothetical protein
MSAEATMTLGEFYSSGLVETVAPKTHEQLRLAEAYANVFDSPHGEIVWRDLMQATGALASPYQQGDPHDTMVRLGRHQVGLHLLTRRKWSEAQFRRFGEQITFSRVIAQERFAEGEQSEEEPL